MELILKYKQRLEEFCKIDSMNLPDRAKQLVGEKQFWVTKLSDHRIDKRKLEKQQKKLKSAIVSELPIANITKKTLEEIDNHPKLEDITEKIAEHADIIEYLTEVSRIVSWLHKDIENIIELRKYEME